MNKLHQGFIAPTAVVLMFVFFLVGVSAMAILSNTHSFLHNENLSAHAQLAADAGLEDALQQLKDDPSWTPSGGVYAGEVELMNENGIRTTYQLTLTGSDPDNQVLRSTGRVYRAGSTTAAEKRSYEVAVSSSSTPGSAPLQYSTIAGPGGLTLNASAVVRGNVYVGGFLSLNGGSRIITGSGNSVQVANNRCPTSGSSGYPRPCNPGEGGQPISLLTGSSISGLVFANDQTSSSGMSGPGLQMGVLVPVHNVPPPPDRAPIKAATEAGTVLTGSEAGCSYGSRTWPANTKINGNVEVSGGCKVTIQGDVWITGNLKVRSSSNLRIQSSIGRRPVVMIDGSDGMEVSSGAQIITTSGVGARFATYYHPNSSCNPDCTSISGSHLRIGIAKSTIVFNASSSVQGSGAEFIAAWTRVHIAGSSDVSNAAIAAQAILLGSSAGIISSTHLTDTGTIGGSSEMSFGSYRRVYID